MPGSGSGVPAGTGTAPPESIHGEVGGEVRGEDSAGCGESPSARAGATASAMTSDDNHAAPWDADRRVTPNAAIWVSV